MMLRFHWLAVGLLLSLLTADTVSAGLFGFGRRRWACRKAQLRAELLYDLENKLDEDLAEKADAINEELTAAAEEEIERHAKKLEEKVDQALAELREKASEQVASEADRLEKKVQEQVAKLEKQSREQVASETEKLKKQMDSEIERLNQKFAEETQALRSTVEEELAKVPEQVSQQVEKSIEQDNAKKTASDQPAEPAKKGNEPADDMGEKAKQATALPSKEVQLVESGDASDEG